MTEQDPHAWELAPLRETFLACFGDAHGAALRQLGSMAHGLALGFLPFAENREGFEMAELRAVAADLRYVENYLRLTVAGCEGAGLPKRRERALRRLAEKWARRVGGLAGEIEAELLPRQNVVPPLLTC